MFARERPVGPSTRTSGERGQKTAAFGSAANGAAPDVQSFQSGPLAGPEEALRGCLRHGTKKNPASRL